MKLTEDEVRILLARHEKTVLPIERSKKDKKILDENNFMKLVELTQTKKKEVQFEDLNTDEMVKLRPKRKQNPDR